MTKRRYFPKTINGQEIPIRTTTDNIICTDNYGSPTKTLTKKLDDLYNEGETFLREDNENAIVYDDNKYDSNKTYKKFTIISNKGQSFMSIKESTNNIPRDNSSYWLPLSRHRENICLLEEKWTDKRYKIESEYGYTYNDLSNMLSNNDYYGYIQNGDYIWVNWVGGRFKFLANVDIYRNTDEKPHNIDFICTEIETNQGGHYSNPDDFYNLQTSILNNPLIRSEVTPIILNNFMNPFIVKSIVTNGISNGFSEDIRSHIVDKYKMVPVRNFDKSNDTAINKTDWAFEKANLGKVWMLYENEIKSYVALSSLEDGMCCEQYPIFQKFYNREFRFNGDLCHILTSSLLSIGMKDQGYEYSQLDLNPIMIIKDTSMVYSDAIKHKTFPMFGIRFV